MERRTYPKPERPRYNEQKTTQAAALFLMLHGDEMPYMKLVKLLYNLDRESLKRWGRPVTYDEAFSLRHGLVLSITLDKAETSDPILPSYWDEYIRTSGYNARLINEIDDGELSDAEVELIQELADQYREASPFDIEKEHHDPDLFPEWENPGLSRIPTSISKILSAVGYSDEKINQINEDIAEDARLLQLMNS